MENKIQLLSPELINQIAAGEVVERPASIVKELLENAIDSGATNISLDLEHSGLDTIAVSDNGAGMNKLEAVSALLQHATSKISSSKDLFNISTLGFRGEALASISSISELSIHTYNGIDSPVLVSKTEQGTTSVLGAGRAKGTTVTARKIFHNVPARRKFLKSETTEYKYILESFINVALSRPEIAFKLTRDGKLMLNLSACTELWQRIVQIFPKLQSSQPILINYDDPQTRITGFLGHPISAKAQGSEQYLFINGRYIKNSLIAKAIKEGYGTALMHGINPTFFLFMQVSNDIVDVNVHPRKLEVRFSDPGRMFATVNRAVSSAVNKKLTSDLHDNFATESLIAPNSNTVNKSMAFSQAVLSGSQDLSKSYPLATLKLESLTPISRSVNKQAPQAFLDQPLSQDIVATSDLAFNIQINEVSQVFNTYLIFTKDAKLLFVDQHAAAERVNFERITAIFSAGELLNTQRLLLPETIKLTATESLTIKEHLEVFKKMGFEINTKINNQIEISSIPQILANQDILSTFHEILDELKNSNNEHSIRWREIEDKLIATLACHASIRAGQKLLPIEAHKLILDLFKCQLPYSCPHGRPIIWELEKYQLEKNFKRKL